MRWLGFDLGEKRTGVAISNPEGTFAVPLTVLEHDESGPSPEQIDALLGEHEVQGIVAGLPLSLSGSPSQHTHRTVRIAQAIALHIGATLQLPADMAGEYPDIGTEESGRGTDTTQPSLRMMLWDERLSTWEAQQLLPPSRKRKQNGKGKTKRLDAHAAAIILQSYLDSLHSNDAPLPDLPNLPDDDVTQP